MKAIVHILHVWSADLVAVSAIVGLLFLTASPRSLAQSTSKTEALQAMVDAVSAGIGTVRSSNLNGTQGPVFVFEEFHNSRIGQLQIALMLMHLREQANLKRVVLEGAIERDTPLDADWFHGLGGADANIDREDVAVRMLGSGEISAPEFMTMLYPDVKVYGCEVEDLYQVKLDANGNPGAAYLSSIALSKLTQDDVNK